MKKWIKNIFKPKIRINPQYFFQCLYDKEKPKYMKQCIDYASYEVPWYRFEWNFEMVLRGIVVLLALTIIIMSSFSLAGWF